MGVGAVMRVRLAEGRVARFGGGEVLRRGGADGRGLVPASVLDQGVALAHQAARADSRVRGGLLRGEGEYARGGGAVARAKEREAAALLHGGVEDGRWGDVEVEVVRVDGVAVEAGGEERVGEAALRVARGGDVRELAHQSADAGGAVGAGLGVGELLEAEEVAGLDAHGRRRGAGDGLCGHGAGLVRSAALPEALRKEAGGVREDGSCGLVAGGHERAKRLLGVRVGAGGGLQLRGEKPRHVAGCAGRL